MMSLIFLIQFSAMVMAFKRNYPAAYSLFALGIIVALFWFNHHATDTLDIML
ncbi:MAG: DUF5993 family protein [Methyloprofundus sp.]